MKICRGWHSPNDLIKADEVAALATPELPRFIHPPVVFDDAAERGQCPVCRDAFLVAHLRDCVQRALSGLVNFKQMIAAMESYGGVSFNKPEGWEDQ